MCVDAVTALKSFFARETDVSAAYLYGRYATDRTWPDSDLEVALVDERTAGGRSEDGLLPTSLFASVYFDNASRDSGDAYLAEGLTEAIITQLGQIERVGVCPRVDPIARLGR